MTFLTQGVSSAMDFPDYMPKRFGLNFDPPMIILEYLVPSTGKLYHHKMRLRKLNPTHDPQEILKHLRARHSMYVNHNKIGDD